MAERVFAQIRLSGKPTVVCFLGADPLPIEAACGLHVTNLTQAAAAAGALARGEAPEDALAKLEQESAGLIPLAAAEQSKLATGQHALRGLFAGGTFCYEAQLILRNLPEPVYSNAPLEKTTCWPLKARVTRPLPHLHRPGRGRVYPGPPAPNDRSRAAQPAHPPGCARSDHRGHPAGHRAGLRRTRRPGRPAVEAIREAQQIAAEAGRHIVFVASVCGTEADPQPLSRQEAKLRVAGIIVLPDNAAAARLAGLVTQALHE